MTKHDDLQAALTALGPAINAGELDAPTDDVEALIAAHGGTIYVGGDLLPDGQPADLGSYGGHWKGESREARMAVFPDGRGIGYCAEEESGYSVVSAVVWGAYVSALTAANAIALARAESAAEEAHVDGCGQEHGAALRRASDLARAADIIRAIHTHGGEALAHRVAMMGQVEAERAEAIRQQHQPAEGSPLRAIWDGAAEFAQEAAA